MKKWGYSLYYKDLFDLFFRIVTCFIFYYILSCIRNYRLPYLIGEEEYLNKGIGKIIIKKLEEKIIEINGKEILADPVSENIISQKTLFGNKFIKINEGDYRKKLY